MDILIARWETKGKDYLDLFRGSRDYFYRGRQCGGGVPDAVTDEQAIAWMEKPWGPGGAGAATVLRSDRPSLKRVK